MTDPLSVVWPLLDLPGAVLSADAAAFWTTGLLQELCELGVLRPMSGAERVLCPECRDHVEDVFAISGPGGRTRYAINCPEHLRVVLSSEDLQQWIVDVNHVAGFIASAFQLTGNLSELTPGRIWRMGRWKYQGQTRDMLLAVGLNHQDAIEIRRQITASKRPVVFVPLAEPDTDFWVGQPPPLIRLSEVVEFVEGSIDIDVAQVIEVIHDASETLAESASKERKQQQRAVRRAVKEEIKSLVNDDNLVAAYKRFGSYDKAVAGLKEEGVDTNRWAIERAVKRAGGAKRVMRGDDSESVVRTRSSQRRDTPIKKVD